MTWTGRVQVCGALLVCLVLADVFFTVLFPASGHGPIRRTLSRLTWWLFGTFGRRLPRPRRRRLLAYSGPLHHRTYGTATAVQFLVGLADEGALPQAGQQLSHLSDFLTETYETHHAYPVLHHFHFRDVRYALPQLLLIALDVAALVRTGLDRDRHPGLVRSTAVYQVSTAALELLDELYDWAEIEPPL